CDDERSMTMAQAKPVKTNGLSGPDQAEGGAVDHSGWVQSGDQYRLNQPHDHKAQRLARR
ncbi:MAG: hypothetical protein KDE63_13215, partial [Novosphingobium sp.]|nr:hypothetical protein [Novosphingobium sp.]